MKLFSSFNQPSPLTRESIIKEINRKIWLNEFLFWMHLAVIVTGLLVGLVLPWWLALSAIAMHRLHLKIVGGCILSRLQQSTSGLGEKEDYLQQLSQRLFGLHLPKRYVKRADHTLVCISLGVIAMTYIGLGVVALSALIIGFTLLGTRTSWTIYSRGKAASPATSNVCTVGGVCGAASSSNYSQFFGVKVELLGLIYFMLMSLVQLFLAYVQPSSGLLNHLILGLVFSGFSASIWFIFVQARLLKSLCQACMNVHGASLSVCALHIFRTVIVA